jgi:hypothetical protein
MMSDTMLSSRMTFFSKIVMPTVWVCVFGAVTAAVWMIDGTPAQMRLLFLLAFVVGAVSFWLFCVPLKQVRVDGGNLYVSNFRQEIAVPLAAIARVSENRWVNIHPVTIYLRTETAFGSKIMFMPKQRLAFTWTSHPVVNEIRQMAAAAASGGGR